MLFYSKLLNHPEPTKILPDKQKKRTVQSNDSSNRNSIVGNNKRKQNQRSEIPRIQNPSTEARITNRHAFKRTSFIEQTPNQNDKQELDNAEGENVHLRQCSKQRVDFYCAKTHYPNYSSQPINATHQDQNGTEKQPFSEHVHSLMQRVLYLVTLMPPIRFLNVAGNI